MVASNHEIAVFERWMKITRLTALSIDDYRQAIKHLPKHKGYAGRLSIYIRDETPMPFGQDHKVVYINGKKRLVHKNTMPLLEQIFAIYKNLTPRALHQSKKGKR